MTYEVELKFPLADFGPVARLLAELGAVPGETVAQRDQYFNHPCRDFAQTDEAFRLRSVGDAYRITYKGPLIDTRTKTRREIELPITADTDDAARLAELLTCLGFRPVRPVAKTRTLYALTWDSRDFEIAVDRVDGLGLFLEIETQADDADRDAACDTILRLARRLGLENSERRSYLQLLLERDESSRGNDQ